ncbi:efflux RND transporter permease subunit [Hoeflea prorocentri]|uniref:Efflux RND transporter permease subunit n=1 Tax=Hoeflea prorocentri TaxID=1922333 RepID=A0A9X3ZJD3_9HYPH|nr:efflux RND transporter permease subunit [Hoeflea prorocentri]MCY6383339.1 efflux RND transporter permease subunit [Hoeflea prorocentri]MDA5401139.1 efflux RND transporter permease subunit [Hoeflea prorocentri]
MDFLTRFGISKSRLTILVMIALILQGLLSYGSMPKRENPAITIRSALISAQFPGMSPDRMENLIVKPIERKAREIGEIEDINSLISTGSTVVTVNIYDHVPSSQLSTVFEDIRNKMDDLKPNLPSGTEGPFVNTDYGDVAIATIAVTGEGFENSELRDSADDLREYLYEVDGISKVSLFGVQEERVWLELDTRKLAAVGVQLSQVLDDLQSQNVILPAGEIDADGVNLILEANGDLASVEEIGDVLTKVQGLSGFVRLKDLMNVRRGYQDPVNKPVYFDGQEAVIVSVEMTDTEDIQKIGAALKTAVAQFEQTQPIGITYKFSTFQETNVTTSINAALMNVLQTFAVVLVVMLIFLGFRGALIIACIVPFTVTFALVGMRLMEIDLQQISIAAVIISLGLLVDNGLVVVEDIEGRIKRGMEPEEAALGAGRQFFIPLAVASITTVSAFIPMLILDGVEGEFAFSLGAVVGIMLAGSWFTALYILPSLCVWFARRKSKDVAAGPNLMVRSYGAIIGRTLTFGPFIIIGCYLAVAASISLFSSVKNEMFPLSERAEYMIYLNMPKGTAISATRAEALRVEEWLQDTSQNPEVVDTTVFVGDGGPRFYLALNPADTDPASAFILINTETFEGAVTAAARATRHLIENHPSARFKVKRLSMGGGESGIVEVKLSGSDAEKLLMLADEVEVAFDAVPGISQNENDWGNKTLKIVIDVDQSKARELGVSSQEISDVMDTFYSGTSFSTYREGDQSIPIVVRAEESFRRSIEDLASLSVPADGRLVSLDQVATFDPQLEFSQIRRENQIRTIKISGKSDTLAADRVLSLIRPTLDQLDLSGGYRLEIAGETENSAEVNATLAAGMPLALLVMLAALMFQFNSARRVLLTFMTVPLIIIGAPLALLITGKPLSFFAILGMISLAGIIINNAIVLIDQIDIERKTADLKEAVVEAAKKRVTPILLTSLTTIFGLMPMAINGGALFEPMATLMIGGLAVASVLSLFFVPGAYYLLFGGLWSRSKTKDNVAAESA